MKKRMKKLSVLLAAATALGAMSVCTTAFAETETETASAAGEKPGAGKTLKVAMECGYAPYNWTQPDDSNGAVPISGGSDYAYGYDVMMAKHICEELGYELEIVKLDWDSLVPAVQSGTVDCVIAGQSITKERENMVDFSEPYYYASIITLTKSDSAYAEESAPAMLVALNAGKCDIVVTDKPTGMAALVAYPDFKLLDFSGTDGDFEVSDEEINIGISMKKGNTELKEQIDGVLSKMTEDDFNEMMDEAISVQPLSE